MATAMEETAEENGETGQHADLPACPGSSRHSMLISESFEDLTQYYSKDVDTATKKLTPSEVTVNGTLSESDVATDSVSVKPPTPDASPLEEDDLLHDQEWLSKSKHIFILSSAGKPIYSRYGNEDKLVTTTGVMQVLVSCVQDNNDNLKCLLTDDKKFVFLVRDHLILVAVSGTSESVQHILLQLNYIYNQVLSVLTHSQLNRIFENRKNYDLRRLLTGAEKFLDNLATVVESDPACMLGAVRCLPLDSSIRSSISEIIAQRAKVKDLVFAILIAKSHLITMVRLKKYLLHPVDLHLVLNLVASSESFKSAESWTPVCLPKFDDGGYLHAHISYLDEACTVCLLMLAVDKDMFFTLSECKRRIQEKMLRHKHFPAIAQSLAKALPRASQTGITDLRHFLYKCRSTAEFISSAYEVPYTSESEQQRIFSLYQNLHSRIHSATRPMKIVYQLTDNETLLGWVTLSFELYAIFSPLVTKSAAINSVNRLLKWVKKEEDSLFILTSPTF